MGSDDGAETCELVGICILSQLQHLGINIGLYCDDGLAVMNKTSRQTELIKKEICKIFKENLKITIETQLNLKTGNFLDISTHLKSETYQPYMKPNSKPLYIHLESNHPPTILKTTSQRALTNA